MQQLDKWWAESPFERRPELPARVEEHVPVDLQFQRVAHDANLGKQTSDLMRLSPVFFQRFGAGDNSLRAHLADGLAGMWEYLLDEPDFASWAWSPVCDIWLVAQHEIDWQASLEGACESI